jgi:circadian clock protein KaiB
VGQTSPVSAAPADVACVLRLYISAAAPLSARAIVNARLFLEKHLSGRYELHILSIAEHVQQAIEDQVIAAPTLLKIWPPPARRFIGDLSDTSSLLQGLDLRLAADDT